jgi:glycosyltransferase involved in cell wall biosynthesis
VASRPVVEFAVKQAPVTLLLTRHNDERHPDRAEAAQFLALLERLLVEFVPDVLIAANGHPMIFEAMRDARRRGITTAFAVRGYGYDNPSYFADVNHVFTCSRFLTGAYREKIGLVSTPLEPPLDWSTVVAPADARAFVTFVNPAPHKGLFLFARLADMLGSRRSDIPVLVVQSGQSGGSLNNIPGIDFSRYPQLMAAPPVQAPRDYFALTRVLLVPSVWEEPFGRVAAEAMVNGIPPIVSNRGALPDVVDGDVESGGGGLVRSVPEWMTAAGTRLPTEQEVEPWFAAVCALWDDPALYEAVSARGQSIAAERYSESVSRARHVQYFTSLDPSATPFDAPSRP